MASIRIQRLPASQGATAEAIIDLLRDYNAPYLGRPSLTPFQLAAYDGETLIGGLLGELRTHWLHIDILVVAAGYRGHDLGSELMQQAEAVAREHRCHGIWLDTFDFQAPGFYERLGFKRFGVIDDFHDGHARHFLEKRL